MWTPYNQEWFFYGIALGLLLSIIIRRIFSSSKPKCKDQYGHQFGNWTRGRLSFVGENCRQCIKCGYEEIAK